MNWRSGAWAFSLLLGAVVALWLRYQPLSADNSGYRLELDLTSPISGDTWLRYDVGAGRNPRDQRIFSVVESAQPRTYRVALPSGVFRSFSIIPPENAHQVLAGARIVAPDGALAARVPALRDTPGVNVIAFAPPQPLELIAPGDKTWLESAVDFVLCAGLVLLLCEIVKRRGATMRERLRGAGRAAVTRAQAHPRTTLLVVALLAVAASCHPVVFFGKSFVSPNNGVLCLYDVHPTLPGAPAQPVEPWNGSDINATTWSHLPYSISAHDAIVRDHEFPLWNRWVMCGLTLFGQGQSMIGDPLYLMTVFSNGSSGAWDLRFLIAKWLFSFGLGLVIWRTVRHLGIAVLLAFSAAFIGYFSYRFNHPTLFGLGYAPWMLLCWLHIAEATCLRRAGWWALALIAADWLELNSGTAKESTMLLIGMNAIGGFAVLFRSEPWRERGKKLALTAAASVLFLAISAPLWVTFLDALRRGYTIYDTPLTNQLAPGLFVSLFDDLFARELMEKEWHVDPALNFLALLGLCWAIVDPRRWWPEPVAKALVVVSVVSAALVFAVIPPALIDRVPFFKNISHVDDVYICVLIVPLFVLAGFGLRNCLEKARTPEVWCKDWIGTLLMLAGIAALYVGTVSAVPRSPEFGLQLTHPTAFSGFFIGYALALFAAVALLPWLACRLVSGRGSVPANGFAVLLCLVAIHFRHGMWLETKFDPYVMNPQQRLDMQAASPAVDFVHAQMHEPSRAMGFGQILRPGFNTVYRLEGTSGVDAVATHSLAEWYEAGGVGGWSVWWPTLTKANIAANKALYDAMNVRYYFGSAADAEHPAPGLDKIAAADLDVFESKTAWPRAFFTDRVVQYRDVRQLAKWVKEGDGRPFAAVSASEKNAPALSADQASRHIAPARDYRLTANTTTFTIEAPATGIAVLNESFVPDNFRASVNGRRAPYFCVNHIFKGVALPGPGTYRVEFEYWPHSLSTTIWIAGFGLLLIVAGMIALWRMPRRSQKCDVHEPGLVANV